MGPRRPRWRGRLDMPFIGLQSVLRRPMIADLEVLDADVAVLGVPTDEARRSSRIVVRTVSDPRAFPAVHGGRPRRLGPPSWASISRTGDGSRAGSPKSATPTACPRTWRGRSQTSRGPGHVGSDLIEVNPQLDVGRGVTSHLAADTVIEFLGRFRDQPRRAARRERRARECAAAAGQRATGA